MKTVKIKGKDWIIIEDPTMTDEGECDQENRTIKVKNNDQTTLTHELIHAYLWECGLRQCCEWATNEEIVDWFANVFEDINNSIFEHNSHKDNTFINIDYHNYINNIKENKDE